VGAMDSDLEGASDEELPNLQAWGKQKKQFYNTDYVDQDFGGFGGEKEEEAAKLEEEEALRIQKKLADELDEEDFALMFQDEPKVKYFCNSM
jgi:U3 small nucleolar RNA-associated protein 3